MDSGKILKYINDFLIAITIISVIPFIIFNTIRDNKKKDYKIIRYDYIVESTIEATDSKTK